MLYCPVNENKSSLGFATLTPRFFNSNTAGESSKFGFHDVAATAAAVDIDLPSCCFGDKKNAEVHDEMTRQFPSHPPSC